MARAEEQESKWKCVRPLWSLLHMYHWPKQAMWSRVGEIPSTRDEAKVSMQERVNKYPTRTLAITVVRSHMRTGQPKRKKQEHFGPVSITNISILEMT